MVVKSEWQVQKAKAELSAVLNAAQKSPQVITRHGKRVAVVLAYDDYERLSDKEPHRSLFSLLRSWPDFAMPERDRSDAGRDVSF